MKKLVISLLSSLMLISCLSGSVFADNTSSRKIPFLWRTAAPAVGSTDPIEIPEEYAEKVANIVINFAWAFSGGGNFLYGACLSGGIVGIVNIASDLLEQLIYFGPSKEELQRQELMDKLDSIDASIGDVNKKVDSLADQINKSIKQIDEKLDGISIKLDKDNITNLANVAASLRNQMDNFNGDINTQIQYWYDNKHIDDFLVVDSFMLKVPDGTTSNITVTDEKGVIYPSGDRAVNNLSTIEIPRELMSAVINGYINEHKAEPNHGWDADKKDDIAKEIFKRIILDPTLDKATSGLDAWVNTKYRKAGGWDSLTSTQQNEAINTLADAGYASLCEIAAKNIARTLDGTNTYVKNLINDFTIYCNYLSAARGEYTSPLESYANIYSSIFAFQGDLKTTVEFDEYDKNGKPTGKKLKEDTNLLKICMEKYIGELNQLGTFVGIMAKASGNYGENTDMRSLVYLPWAQAEQKLKDDYKKFYHTKTVKVNGRDTEVEVDNYCYITNTVLGYFAGSLSCDLVMKFYAWENGFGTDIKSFRDTYMATDWTFNMDNNKMVDNTNMSLIFAHYANTKGNVSFKEYLENNKIKGKDDYNDLPSTIVTNFTGSRGFTSEDKVNMFIKNCHNNPDKWEGKDYLKGDTTTVTSSSSNFKVRRKATADVFDINTGVATLGKRIGAVASFYEKYTFKDDLVVFWDAEYNNPANRDELLALARKDENNYVYWRERYDTDADDEERYRSHVEYVRDYGVILSYSLDDPSAPVPTTTRSSVTVNNPNYGFMVANKITIDPNEALDQALEKYGLYDEDFKDTYLVYFDETKYGEVIDQELYTKIINYCQDKDSINRMIDDYYSYNSLINDMINKMDSNLFISDNVEALAKALIENDLDCIVVDSIPTENLGKNVYNYTDGNLYIWESNKYVKYSEYGSFRNKNLKTKEDIQLLGDKEIGANDTKKFAEGFDSVVFHKGDYPSSESNNIKFAYDIKTVLAYELYLDNDGNIQYTIHPIYDVNPILTWCEGNGFYQKQISNIALEKANIGSISIMLPVIELNNEKDNHAYINHYADLNQMQTPIQELNGKISKIDDYKYVKFNTNTFSPYAVSKTYYKSSQKYQLPKTGIN